MPSFDPFPTPDDQAGLTVAALLRQRVPELSWNQARRLVETRHVKLDGEICLDPARRLRAGVVVELLGKPAVPPRQHELLTCRHLAEHVAAARKPSGVSPVPH